MRSRNILAAATLIGTIIGAGVFAIPYVVSRSGVLLTLFYFVLLGLVVLLLHLLYGEVVLRTEGQHQLTGYVKRYLGQKAKVFVLIATVLGTLGSLLVYIILAGEFLKVILPSLSYQQASLIFWLGLSLFVWLAGRHIAKLEFVMSLGILAIFGILFFFCAPQVNLANYTVWNSNYLFLPFGVLLFSLVGWNTIPDLAVISHHRKHLLPIVLWSFLVCLVVYLLFGFLVAGVVGPNMTDKVFESLAPYLGPQVIFLGAVLGLLAIATSFVISANYLKHLFRYDCLLPKTVAFLMAAIIPLALFYLGLNQFLPVIGAVGAFMGLAEGVTICLLFQQAKKKGDRIPEHSLTAPNFVIYAIIIILGLGALVEILNNLLPKSL